MTATVLPFRSPARPRTTTTSWTSATKSTSCSVVIESKDAAPLDEERASLVAHLRALADLVEHADMAFFGEGRV